MAVEQYNAWCLQQGQAVFPITPHTLHSCNSTCQFYRASFLESVCKQSRHVHTCTQRCVEKTSEENNVCDLTKHVLGQRLDYRYFDGSLSFRPTITRTPILSSAQVSSIIYQTLYDIFLGTVRSKLEEKNNRRQAVLDQALIVKESRKHKLHRGNWHSYYQLFMQNTFRNHRRLATVTNLRCLAKNIHLYWKTLFTVPETSSRRIQTFVAVCVTELANGCVPLFPLVPWIKLCAPKQATTYCTILDITCRIMTAMLMQIRDLSQERQIGSFPLYI